MFTAEYRDHVRHHVLEMAKADPRVTAAATTGSMAFGPGDTWSDVDVAFGIAEGRCGGDARRQIRRSRPKLPSALRHHASIGARTRTGALLPHRTLLALPASHPVMHRAPQALAGRVLHQ
jgi:hypothetical protein